jgi:hypothetical protein
MRELEAAADAARQELDRLRTDRDERARRLDETERARAREAAERSGLAAALDEARRAAADREEQAAGTAHERGRTARPRRHAGDGNRSDPGGGHRDGA